MFGPLAIKGLPALGKRGMVDRLMPHLMLEDGVADTGTVVVEVVFVDVSCSGCSSYSVGTSCFYGC